MASDQATTAVSAGTEPEEPRGGALTNRDFVKLFAGESVSLIGTQITLFTMPLIAVLTLRATVFQVGLLNTLRLAPVIVVAVFAGVLLDRTRRRPVLIVCSLTSAVLIALVPLSEATGHLSMGLLYLVSALVGGLSCVFDVGVLSYVPNLLERRHLPEANGKIQAVRAFAGISGPAIAGLLIGVIGAPVTLSADAISYLFSVGGLISIRKPEAAPQLPEVRTSVRRQIAEGFHAVYGSKLVRAMLTQAAALNLAYGSFLTIFVVYAIRSLHLTPFKLGLAVGAVAVGGLIGSLFTNRARKVFGLGRSMIYSTIASSAAPLVLLIPRNAGIVSMTIMMAAQFVYGLGIASLNVNAITLRQVITPRRVLARMNATYRMLIFGVPPLGAIIGGVLGTALGLRPALVISVIAITSPMLWLIFSPVFRLKEMPAGPDENLGTLGKETAASADKDAAASADKDTAASADKDTAASADQAEAVSADKAK
jgi:MFS family permease